MSNADFQQRLQRIGSGLSEQQPLSEPVQASRPGKPKLGRLAIGAFFMMLGVQVVKYANQSYEAIKDTSGIGAAAGLGLAGCVSLLVGIVLMYRAVSSSDTPQPIVKKVGPTASRPARVITSLIGFAFGATATFYMFLAAAAGFVDTERAQQLELGGTAIALILAAVSLAFGLLGIFIRGYALGRVPLYFLCGGILTFAAFRIFQINVLEWEPFIAQLQ